MESELDNPSIARLIVAAGGTDEQLRQAVDDFGPHRVAALLVQEVAFRADVPLAERPSQVRFDIVDGADRFDYLFEVEPGKGVIPAQGDAARAAQLIEYDLLDLCREVYGAGEPRRAAARRTELLYGPSINAEMWQAIVASQPATAAILSGIDNQDPDLGILAARYNSDKWGGLHWFTPHYEKHLRHLRTSAVRVLEIGIGGYAAEDAGGGSLKMWRRYFPRGSIFGLDIFDKSVLDQPRVTTLRGDQSDGDFLAGIAAEYGPFDLIIDDGSHINEHIHASFNALFPHVRSGGLYVIEDMWTSYLPGYGGDDGPVAGSATSVGLVKRLIDAVNYQEHQGGGTPDPVAGQVVGVHTYHNLTFIEKGRNAEGAIPQWVPRTPAEYYNRPTP
jgi:hypothetical protein